MAANTSHDSSNGSASAKEAKRQQFTNKQRMDMYAFCVLELEMHSSKVSIKKQQQAIQKVLNEQQKESQNPNTDSKTRQQPQPNPSNTSANHVPSTSHQQQQQFPDLVIESTQIHDQSHETDNQLTAPNPGQPTSDENQTQEAQGLAQDQTQPKMHNPPRQDTILAEPISHSDSDNGKDTSGITPNNSNGVEGKTLLELQQEVALTRKCYSDYQRTQVLTSSMLREVQKRFAKYYPDSAIPSRTTIKHVFEKCVAHGTVENMRTPKKVTKIPQGDEIEYLVIHEPQLSLRQMAQKLNISTGTVSRRCKALGLVPESVTIKHQQMATARRQKQIKQLESNGRAPGCNKNGTRNT